MTAGNPPPRLLTIAGSDSGGGAGIQADLKAFAAWGTYGMSALTAVTAQNTVAVTGVVTLPPAFVAQQIDAVFEDLGVDAVKIGMLADAAVINAVADRLEYWLARRAVPVVLDPVMVAKSGDALLADDAVDQLRTRLLPLATVVTPNLPEAERLTGRPLGLGREAERIAAARVLGAYGPAVLLKGGHDTGPEVADLLFDPRQPETPRWFRHPRLATRATHGTGCTLSSALAARLAAGVALEVAVGEAIDYLQGALAAAWPLGHGHGPVNHFHRVFPAPKP
ncbi:MAG: bifunctional hydroxymethylpyrimidine kinase/phosphomethylpyrimidine kinase [Thermoanaerobaculia bacterium]|nr:bifunctional hydroxymethylpyrimidine kinase/phosphomethylpyrimidine kinase [Thermoanaerobaculia bacterium]